MSGLSRRATRLLTSFGRLNQEINIALTDPKIKQRIAELADTPIALSVAGFTKLISDETEKWGKVIRAAGIKPD